MNFTALMTCYNTPMADVALKNMLPNVASVRIAYGPTRANKNVPENGTLKKILAVESNMKIVGIFIREVWKSKLEMFQQLTANVCTDYVLVLDGDEIWVGLDKWIPGQPISIRFINFWHDTKHYIIDSDRAEYPFWGTKLEPYGGDYPVYRMSKWDKNCHFINHSQPVDAKGRIMVNEHIKNSPIENDILIYHFGYALSSGLMADKFNFYKERDKNPDTVRREKMWKEWNGQCGEIDLGVVYPVKWNLPKVVTEAV